MIQCFASPTFDSSFEHSKPPRLISASKIDSSYSIHPRVLHKHNDFLELLYVRSGTGVYIVDEQRYNICEGDIIICNAGVLHDEDPSQAQASALIAKLLLVIRKYCENEGNTVRSRTDIIAGQVKHYIDTHFDEQFTLQDISDAIRVSPYHLAHMFKETTGYSPMQYTVRRRLGEAQSLLITTSLSVTEIAVSVGFGNPCHFNTMFSKYIGMSPSRYRSSYVARADSEPDAPKGSRKRKQM